jgi:hypothetical protein
VDEEWAARQLAFLRDTRSGAPSGASTVPLPDASAEIAVLEGVLDKGLELSDTERQRIADRVHQWMGAFQRIYVAEVIRAELRRSSAGTAERSVHGEVQVIDSSPPGWDDHVLRISMDGQGTARVSTRRREPPKGEETQTYEDLLLDWERCAEAPRHVRELERLTALAGLTLTFEFEEPPPKPEPRHASRPARDDRPAPKTRSHDQEGRP